MSGILGVWNSERNFPWQKMLEDLRVLGLDSIGEWHDNDVGLSLGRTQFFNTPESCQELPVINYEGCVIVWDGRIDDRECLLRGRNSVTDAQLIIESYRRWGVNCLKYLFGEYVFILWDKTQELLFVGCDVVGGSTLSYHWNGKTLLLSSRATTLLHHPQVSPKLNDLYIAHNLNTSHGYPPGITVFENIQRLLPGHGIVLQRGNFKQIAVARLKQTDPFLAFSSSESCYEKFWEILDQVVKDRLRTEHSVATYLSGGLDSTTITLSILNQLSEVDAFTNTTDIFPEFDEREPIKAFLEQYPQVRWHGINGDRALALREPWDELPLPDDPLIACTIPMHLQLMQEMRRLKCQVVFEGDWGDEVFNVGLRDLSGKSLITAITKNLKSCSSNLQRKNLLYQYFLLPNLPEPLKTIYFNFKGNVSIVPWLQKDYVEGEVFQQSLQQKFFSRLPKQAIQVVSDYATRTASIGYRQTYRLLGKLHGLQITSPFQDRRIIEFSLGLKPEMKISNEYYKIFMRQVNRGKLPDEILWRPKENYFNPLIYAGIAEGEKSLELLDYLNSSEALQVYFDKDKFANKVHQYRREFADGYQPYTRYKPLETIQLFASLGFINWHKRLSKEISLS